MRGSEPPPPGPQRFVGAVVGLIFCAIGVIFIGQLWTTHGFGEPPLFFKLAGSLILLAFITIGGTIAFTALKGPAPRSPAAGTPSSISSGAGYTCPACGARLGEDADVSPKGDVKCGYCRKWFNIHDR